MRWLRVAAIFLVGLAVYAIAYVPLLVVSYFPGHRLTAPYYTLEENGWWIVQAPPIAGSMLLAALAGWWLRKRFLNHLQGASAHAATTAIILASVCPAAALYFYWESTAIANVRGQHAGGYAELATLHSLRGRPLLEAPFVSGSPDAIVAGEALLRLGGYGRRTLVRIATDSNVPVRGRYDAALSLLAAGDASPAARNVVDATMRDPDPAVRMFALQRFDLTRGVELRPDSLYVSVIAPRLKDADPAIVAKALGNLMGHNLSANPPVCADVQPLLDHPSADVRRRALYVFTSCYGVLDFPQQFRDREGLIAILKPHLSDPDPACRSAVANVLARLGV